MSMQNVVIGLAGLVVVLGAWSFWSGKGFGQQSWQQQKQQPQQSQRPRGQGQQPERQRSQHQNQDEDEDDAEGKPEDWTEEEMKTYLEHRGEEVDENTETRVMLLARIQELKR